MPRSLSRRVLVEKDGRRKWVLRRQLASLSPNWKRVAPKKKRPPAKKAAAEPSAESAPAVAEPSSPVNPAEGPDAQKE